MADFGYHFNDTTFHGTICYLESLTKSWTGALSLESMLMKQNKGQRAFIVGCWRNLKTTATKRYLKCVTSISYGNNIMQFFNNFKIKHRFFWQTQAPVWYYIGNCKSNVYISLFLSWGLLMSILQLFHLWTSTFDLTCLIRWCFLKSIMGFSLLISSSLNAASLR